MSQIATRLAGSMRRLPVRWKTVALFALALTYADGFWVTVIQVTIGAIERTEAPLIRWLRDATLMLPLVFLAVVAALLAARRLAGRGWVGLAGTALLIALFTGGASIAEVAASSAYDYSFQTQHLELMHSYGVTGQAATAELAGFGASPSLGYTLYCNLRGVAAGSAVAQLEYATLMLHVRALGYASALLLTTNLIVVALLLALCYDRLWSPQVAASPWADEPTSQATAAGAVL